MRILFVISSLSTRGGAERVVSILSQSLQKRHQVAVAAFEVGTPAYPYGGRIIELGGASRPGAVRKTVNAARRVRRLSRLFVSFNPDRIITMMESANLPSVVAAARTGKLERLYLSVHLDPDRLHIAHRLLVPFLYSRPARVVAVSEGIRDRLIARFGLSPERCVVVHNPIDAEAIRRETANGIATFVRPAERYIVAMGRLVYQKGFDDLIKAYGALDSGTRGALDNGTRGALDNGTRGDVDIKTRGALEPDTPALVILGEGPERQALETLIRDRNLEGRVLLPGEVTNPYPYLANAEFFVLSSRFEGQPMALVEAMVCGCPIVSTRCKYGPVGILEDGVTGLLVEPGSVDALVRGMRRLLEDETLRRTLAANAARDAERFSVENISEKWLE